MGSRCRLLQPLAHHLRACRREGGTGPQSSLKPYPLLRPSDLEDEEEEEEGLDLEEDEPTSSKLPSSSSYLVGEWEPGRWGRGVAMEVTEGESAGGRGGSELARARRPSSMSRQ